MTLRQRLDARRAVIHDIAPELTKRRVLEAAKSLASYKPPVPQPRAPEANQMVKLFDRSHEMIAFLDDLEPSIWSQFDIEDLHDALRRVRSDVDDRIAQLPRRLPPSGASLPRRRERMLKDNAAELCREMLTEVGERPKIKRGSVWVRLSAILFYVAFGRRSGGMYRVCQELPRRSRA
jgi:hypothetical protein